MKPEATNTKTRLITSAMDLIHEVGYSAVTTPAIAQKAGVSRGALQHHFASRAELDEAILSHVMRELNFRLEPSQVIALPIQQRVRTIIDSYWKVFSNPLFLSSIDVWMAVGRDHQRTSVLKQHLTVQMRDLEDLWCQVFADVDLPGSEINRLRRFIMGTLRGYAIERLYGLDGDAPPALDLLEKMALQVLQGIVQFEAVNVPGSVAEHAVEGPR